MTGRTHTWWMFVFLNFMGFALCFHYGVVRLIVTNDLTHISIFLMALYWIMTAYIGVRYFRKGHVQIKLVRYVANAMQTLGLIGTLIGMSMLFFGAGGLSLDPSTVLPKLGTAMFTTLVGAVGMLGLKTQWVILSDG